MTATCKSSYWAASSAVVALAFGAITPGSRAQSPPAESPPAGFDYKELRKELDAARAGRRAPTGKILGLPTESFYHAAPASELRSAVTISNGVKALGKYAAVLKFNQGGAIW